MLKSILRHTRGVLAVVIYSVNTVCSAIPIFIVAVVKFCIPIKPFRKWCGRVLNAIASNWVRVNNFTQKSLCHIQWRVDGLETLMAKDWYLVVANHQSWVDILVLQKIFHGKIPFLKFFLKKELIWIPVIGQAWWALEFPFMRRYSRGFIKKNPHLAGRDLEITRKACERFKTIPVSIMNFAEGTRFTRQKQKKSKSPYRRLLRPKAGGLAFTLGAMGKHLNSFLDVTIAYPGSGGITFWDFLCGNIDDIRVQVRALPITPEMLGDYHNDRQFRRVFHKWLNALWEQKDRCLQSLMGDPEADPVTGREPIPDFKQILAQSSSVLSS